MKVLLKLDGRTASGGSALVMHNERLADPLDPMARAIAAVAKKRNKTEADHERIAWLEFLGGLYTMPMLEAEPNGAKANGGKPVVGVPAWNVLRSLQDGAKRHKRGADVLRGVYPLETFAPLGYDGPPGVVELWQSGDFTLRKSVGVQRARTIRTRPIFVDWRLELPVEVDSKIFDLDTLENIIRDAGVYSGLGDGRPIYGRYSGAIEAVAA